MRLYENSIWVHHTCGAVLKWITSSLIRSTLVASMLLVAGGCDEEVTTPLNHLVAGDTTRSDYIISRVDIGASGSVARDVCPISDTTVWFVGKFFGPDSTGTIDYVNTYNAALWNGSTFVLHRLPAVTQSGTIGRATLRCVSKISTDNIWMFSDAGSYLHWNGTVWTSEWIKARQGSILRSAVIKDQIVLVGGTTASISRGYGSIFVLDQNPIDRRYAVQDFAALHGSGDDVFAVAEDETYCKSIVVRWNGIKKVWEEYKIFIQGASDLSLDKMVLTSICRLDDSTLLICGGICPSTYLVLQINVFNPKLNSIAARLPSRPNIIRAMAKNDAIVAGENGMIYHFNGSTWVRLQGEKWSPTTIYSLTVMPSGFIACGFSSNAALALIGQLPAR